MIWEVHTAKSIKKTRPVADSPKIGDEENYRIAFITNPRKKHIYTSTEDMDKMAKNHGLNSYKEYLDHLRKKKGFHSQQEYLTELAKQKGVTTPSEYFGKLMRRRASDPRYKALANSLTKALNEKGMSVAELARRTDIDRQTLYTYLNGYFYPRPERMKLLAEVLDLPLLIPKNMPETGSEYRRKHFQEHALNPKNQRFVELMKTQMKKLSLNLFKLSKKSGINMRLLSQYQHGYHYPKDKNLRKLSRALRLPALLDEG